VAGRTLVDRHFDDWVALLREQVDAGARERSGALAG
jgi:hypothetical protein